MFTIAQLTKVHLYLWPWLTFAGHFKVIHKFDIGWPSRGYFKIRKVKIACGVSCLRDGNHVCHRTPILIRWPWPSSIFIWRHESAIPATAGLLVHSCINCFWCLQLSHTYECTVCHRHDVVQWKHGLFWSVFWTLLEKLDLSDIDINGIGYWIV